MAIKKHAFISANGTLLPRWKEAFPKATVATTTSIATLTADDFIWLRLRSGSDSGPQIEALRAQNRAATLIVLSDIPSDDEAMLVFSLSARGYANAHAAADTLKQIAKVVEQGGLWIGVSLMQRLLSGVNKLPQPSLPLADFHKLTDREMDVAKAIAAGASNKEVARQLAITERTVKAHVSGIFSKLGVGDRLQLALKMREFSA